eukprot:gb/GEZN01002882.1/.p1 GENE.gb/GEZN01002882.1/~~gb/GEZN01002882.1/.p1  ORF type:complete len:695 (-),score=154.68 gb/GEZN01002882.1/:252-2036(-)
MITARPVRARSKVNRLTFNTVLHFYAKQGLFDRFAAYLGHCQYISSRPFDRSTLQLTLFAIDKLELQMAQKQAAAQGNAEQEQARTNDLFCVARLRDKLRRKLISMTNSTRVGSQNNIPITMSRGGQGSKANQAHIPPILDVHFPARTEPFPEPYRVPGRVLPGQLAHFNRLLATLLRPPLYHFPLTTVPFLWNYQDAEPDPSLRWPLDESGRRSVPAACPLLPSVFLQELRQDFVSRTLLGWVSHRAQTNPVFSPAPASALFQPSGPPRPSFQEPFLPLCHPLDQPFSAARWVHAWTSAGERQLPEPSLLRLVEGLQEVMSVRSVQPSPATLSYLLWAGLACGEAEVPGSVLSSLLCSATDGVPRSDLLVAKCFSADSYAALFWALNKSRLDGARILQEAYGLMEEMARRQVLPTQACLLALLHMLQALPSRNFPVLCSLVQDLLSRPMHATSQLSIVSWDPKRATSNSTVATYLSTSSRQLVRKREGATKQRASQTQQDKADNIDTGALLDMDRKVWFWLRKAIFRELLSATPLGKKVCVKRKQAKFRKLFMYQKKFRTQRVNIPETVAEDPVSQSLRVQRSGLGEFDLASQ